MSKFLARLTMWYILPALLLFEFLLTFIAGDSLMDIIAKYNDGERDVSSIGLFYIIFSTLFWVKMISFYI